MRLDARGEPPQIPSMNAAPLRTVLLSCALLSAAFGVTFFAVPAARAQVNLLVGDRLIEAVKANDARSIEELLARGHDPNVTDENQRTALMLAAASGYEDIIALLIRYRAGVNAQDKFGNAALYYAAAADNVGVLKRLLDAGANVDTANRQGATSLMIAAAEGHLASVQMLIDHKADLEATDFTGRTVHDWARRNNRTAVLGVLDRAAAAR